jgi:O-antigen/teichoic acid export membrane protein
MNNNFARNTMVLFAVQIITFIAAFTASAILSRVLGPLGKGQYTTAVTFSTLATLVTGMGLGSAAIYYEAQHIAGRQRIASTAFTLHVVTALLLMLPALWMLHRLDSSIFSTTFPPPVLLLASLLIPVMAAAETTALLLLGVQKPAPYAAVRLLLSLGQLLQLLALGLSGWLRVETALMSLLISNSIATGFALFWLQRAGIGLRLAVARDWFRPLLSYGTRSWIGNLLQYFNYRLDIFMLLAMAGPAAVGYYSIAVAIGETLWFLPQAIATILFPRTATDPVAATRFTPLIARNTLLMTGMAACCIGVFAHPLIEIIYGAVFLPAYSALLLLLPGLVLFAIAKVIASDLNGRGFPQYGTWAALLTLGITLGLNLLLIPSFEINGAAAASSIAYAGNALLLVIFYIRKAGVPLFELLIARPADLPFYQALFQRMTNLISRKTANIRTKHRP